MKREYYDQKKNNVIVAHPLQQHSFKTAEALKKNNLLYTYATTVYYREHAMLYKLLKLILNFDNIKRMQGRQSKILNYTVKSFNGILGVVYLLIVRIDSRRIIEPKLYQILVRWFGNKIFRYIKKNNAKAIIMYDTTAHRCFLKLKRSNNKIVKILDMSSAPAHFIRDILLKELYDEKSNNTSIKNKLKSYKDVYVKRYIDEINNSDYFLVASNFVKNKLIDFGIKRERIKYIPYGVDLAQFNIKDYTIRNENEPLKFLFIGRVEDAKGIFYLLEAFTQLSHLNIELNIIGSINCNATELKNYSKNINYYGLMHKSEISKVMKENDVYILPSLFEGFSFSLFEAMACGLPVIASKNSAADGIINNYEQGFIIEVQSIKDIKDKINWFYINQNCIEKMGMNANKLAMQFTWENYEKNLVEWINKIIEE